MNLINQSRAHELLDTSSDGINWTTRPFGCEILVVVDTDHQSVPQGPRTSEDIDVPLMKRVESTRDEDSGHKILLMTWYRSDELDM